MNLNFTNHPAAQDMINIIMKEKNLSAAEALNYAINREMYRKVRDNGWTSIALQLWGHDDFERMPTTLDNPLINIEFDKLQERLIEDIAEKMDVDNETAVRYFLLFVMESFDYHI